MRFLWRIPDDYPEALIGEYLVATSPDRYDLRQGKTLGDMWGVPEFEFQASCEDLVKYDDLANSAMVPLVSSRVAEFLRHNCHELVELIPAKVMTKSGSLDGFYVVNVRNLGECVDKKKSRYLCIPGTDHPMKFLNLEFLGSPDPRMIVREKIYRGFVVVSDEFEKACYENQWKGVALFRAEEVLA